MIRGRRINPRRVFVDSSAYCGLVDKDEVEHQQLLDLAARLTNERRRLFTTNFVLAETHALVLNRIGRDVAARTLLEIEHGETTIVQVSARDERRARAIIAGISYITSSRNSSMVARGPRAPVLRSSAWWHTHDYA